MSNETILRLLLDTYTDLLKLYAEPGEKSHMLAHHTAFIQTQIRQIIKLHLERVEYEQT